MSSTSLPILSVAQFLDITNEVLTSTEAVVEGEISGLKLYPKAAYFSLKDAQGNAVLPCTAWRSRIESFGLRIADGTQVRIWGVPEIYPPTGRFSFMAKTISPVGEGALKLAFEQLQRKLQAAGYFSPDRKQPLPKFITSVGLVTSERGAAINDFRTHLAKCGFSIQLADTLVQGPHAVASIVAGIEWFNQQANPVEVIVVTRGGGSLEDLQAFNSEAVAKAVFASRIPVLSAVGHEDDVSICDLVADERASTPTAAAKRLSQDWLTARTQLPAWQTQLLNQTNRHLRQYQLQLNSWRQQLPHLFERQLRSERHIVTQLAQELSHAVDRLGLRFSAARQRFALNFTTLTRRQQLLRYTTNSYREQLLAAFKNHTHHTQQRLTHLQEILKLVDPQLILKQGYAIVRTEQGIARSVDQLQLGQSIAIQLHRGQVTSQITKLES